MTNYLVDFNDDAIQADIDLYLSVNECTVVTAFGNLNKVYHIVAASRPPDSDIVTSIIDDDATPIRLLEVTHVPANTPGSLVELQTSDEHQWWKVYSLKDIDLSQPASVPVYGAHTNVYVVDSGIDVDHPEFDNKDVSLVYSFTGDFTDTNGHGTGISSTIVGNTCGLTATSLRVVKIFDKNVATRQSDLLYAFDAILADAIASPNNFSVVNLSWTIPRNTYVEDKILYLINAGMAVVVAAGNSGAPIGDVTPAAMPEVHVIGAYDSEFTPCDFTNYTNPDISVTANSVNHGDIDSWAPGIRIWVAIPGGGYEYAAGTSFACGIYSAGIAYNASQFMTNEYTVMTSIRTLSDATSSAALNLTERTGLLNLSDPKYATSTNKICTYNNVMYSATAAIRAAPTRVICRVGQTATSVLFNIGPVTAYEILSPLPEYATVDRNILILTPTNEPVSLTGVDVSDMLYRVVPSDGSAPIDSSVTLVILSSTFNPSELPADDPLLDITLLPFVCGSASSIAAGCQTIDTGCAGSTVCGFTVSSKACSCS